MAKILPKIIATITIQSWHESEAKGEPGHETKIEATYRDVPKEALLALERVAAGTIQQMADFGEARIEKTCCK